MQKVKLPKRLDPFKCAVQRSEYSGLLLTQEMKRFVDSVVACDESVNVEVAFKKDEQGLTYFDGTLTTSASLTCERCNGQVAQSLHVDFCFSPVRSEAEIEELSDVYDPILVDDHGEVDILKLIEDELILALPLVAFHAEEDCAVSRDDMSFGEIDEEQERPNPFAVLKELKQKKE